MDCGMGPPPTGDKTMDTITKISEIMTAKRGLQTDLDALDVQIAQIVAGIPTQSDLTEQINDGLGYLEGVCDDLDNYKDTVSGLESDLKDMVLTVKDLKRDIESAMDTCQSVIETMKKLLSPKAERWSSDPAE
jgi:archaellum component FlaC